MNLNLIINLFEKNPFILFYGLALIIAIINYHKYYDTSLKYFPIFLLYTFINETLGGLIHANNDFSLHISEFYLDNNWLIFNVYDIVVHLYLFYIFWESIKNNKSKKFILYGSALYILISIINPFFQNFMLHPQNYAYVFAGTILICSIILYFLNRKSLSKPLFGDKDILSWIGAGLLIFYTGYLPIEVIRYYSSLNQIKDPSSYLKEIHFCLIIIMYVCFIVGFIRMKRIKSPS